MYQELPKFDIQYDTSQQAEGMDYWPNIRKDSPIWNFPLARVAIPGTTRFYPTMDYNFCANDSLALYRIFPDPENAVPRTDLKNYDIFRDAPDEQNFVNWEKKKRDYKKTTGKDLVIAKKDCITKVPTFIKEQIQNRVVQAYMNYFNNNYYGSRAPVSIGHHFSPWMGGAYYEAIKGIADRVCGKPEVKCVTYSELMDFMKDKTASGEMTSYRAGAFNRLPRPKAIRMDRQMDLSANIVNDGKELKIELKGKDSSTQGIAVGFNIEGKQLKSQKVTLEKIREMVQSGSDIRVTGVVKDRQGMEIYSTTHVIEKVNTEKELFHEQDLESSFANGDVAHAHENDGDLTLGH
jgi:hypothetical protein